MSCGYDPFKWADTYESIEDYLSDYESEEKENELCNDNRKRQTSNDGNAKRGARG